MLRRLFTLPISLAALSATAVAQSTITVTDADLLAGQTYNWTANNTYVVNGLVYLEAGGTLNIAPGTVVKFRSDPNGVADADNTSALIITKGAKIFARGLQNRPIIMTAEADDVNDPNDLQDPLNVRGQWGGLIILGNGTLATAGGVGAIEGISPSEVRAQYGGGTSPNDAESSGALRFVSIRHGGKALTTDNEINGLTLGAVGRGTEIDYVEVFANDDDGIEWFGGTVDIKHAAVAFCGDDAFDYDTGWRGRGQYWFSINASDIGGRAGEHDGAIPDAQQPFANPTIANATYIGGGLNATVGNDLQDYTIVLRDNAAMKYYNSVFTDFPGQFLDLEDLPTASGTDSYQRLLDGDVQFKGNVLGAFGPTGTRPIGELLKPYPNGDQPSLANTLALVQTGNRYVGTKQILRGISRDRNAGLDPRPVAGADLLDGSLLVDIPATAAGSGNFFDDTNYAGAFASANGTWLEGWTALSTYNVITPRTPATTGVIVDGDLVGGQTYNWVASNTYILNGLVYLEAGGTLNIEAGTVIKFRADPDGPADADNTSALIITAGAKIFANGTAAQPIIMTAEADNVSDPNDLQDPLNVRGQWGGLIILGNGTLATAGGVGAIEGISPSEVRARYGGGTTPNDAESSGRLNYVSIRHGGKALTTDNEINGLTLGAVGRGTEIDYVEIFANDDDGIEWFGGTVDVKHAVVAFGADDAFDYDTGWRGRGQYWFAINASDIGGRTGEHDGAIPDAQQPFANPTIANVTYIGGGRNATVGNDLQDYTIVLRDNAAMKYFNSIFTDYPGQFLDLEDFPPRAGPTLTSASSTGTYSSRAISSAPSARRVRGPSPSFSSPTHRATSRRLPTRLPWSRPATSTSATSASSPASPGPMTRASTRGRHSGVPRAIPRPWRRSLPRERATSSPPAPTRVPSRRVATCGSAAGPPWTCTTSSARKLRRQRRS